MSDPMKSGYAQKQRRKYDAKKHDKHKNQAKNLQFVGGVGMHRD